MRMKEQSGHPGGPFDTPHEKPINTWGFSIKGGGTIRARAPGLQALFGHDGRAGVPGGPRNPLGPRALYLYQDGYDTYYRLHGTVEPWTIGTMASAGCVRLINQDIIDLYRRVPVGTRVVILPQDEHVA